MIGPVRAIVLAFAVVTAGIAAPARAGLKATYVADLPKDSPKALNDMRMIVYIDDAGHDRTDIVVNGKVTGSVVYRDGESYLIDRRADGTVIVSRQSDLTAVTAETFRALTDKWKLPKGAAPAMMYRLVDLGPATVNGRSGTRYGLIQTNAAKGVEPNFQYVISADPALAPLGRIMLRQVAASQQALAAALPGETNMFALMSGILSKGAPLRMERLMSLDTVETLNPDPTLFDLPGPVETIDQVRARIKPLELPPFDAPPGKAPPAKAAPLPTKP